MNRSQRMQPVAKVAKEHQDEAARQMMKQQQQLDDQARRLQDLHDYHDEYTQRYLGVGQVVNAVYIREYRLFLDKLNQAIAAQEVQVQNAQTALERLRLDWSARRTHTESIHKVIDRFASDERYAQERREQHENDEFGQRLGWHRQRN